MKCCLQCMSDGGLEASEAATAEATQQRAAGTAEGTKARSQKLMIGGARQGGTRGCLVELQQQRSASAHPVIGIGDGGQLWSEEHNTAKSTVR